MKQFLSVAELPWISEWAEMCRSLSGCYRFSALPPQITICSSFKWPQRSILQQIWRLAEAWNFNCVVSIASGMQFHPMLQETRTYPAWGRTPRWTAWSGSAPRELQGQGELGWEGQNISSTGLLKLSQQSFLWQWRASSSPEVWAGVSVALGHLRTCHSWWCDSCFWMGTTELKKKKKTPEKNPNKTKKT